jgi:hypothetical protein
MNSFLREFRVSTAVKTVMFLKLFGGTVGTCARLTLRIIPKQMVKMTLLFVFVAQLDCPIYPLAISQFALVLDGPQR